MASIKWKEQYSTGVWWQEKQHKELFDRLGRLISSMERNRGDEEVALNFEFLESYAERHFDAEEAAMERTGYSGARAHAAEHRKLLHELSAIYSEFEAGASLALVIKIQRQLVEWVISHIGNVDKALGAYIRAHEQRELTAVNC